MSGFGYDVGLDAAVLPNWRPSSENEAADIWHHLPQDVVHYDASQLFEPPARGSRVIMTMHDVDDGTCVLDMSDTGVLPTSLKATHKIPSHASPLAESFDALAQLYANAANGVMHMWDMTKHAGATSLERLDIELERLQHIADAERLNLDSVLSMRLAALGVTDVGENRDQEARPKAEAVAAALGADAPRWHFVGQLQTNKAKYVVRYASVVESVDRPELAEALSRALLLRREREPEAAIPDLECQIGRAHV